jgi:hypothetical protein
MREDADFYARLPAFASFRDVLDPARYEPLPADWLIALTDVRGSTDAIAAGRYKAVNTAGAAAIAAVGNALAQRPFPFIFGGDGASLAVAGRDEDRVRGALAATSAWVRDDLDFTLRAAIVPLAAVRAEGLDVAVARYAPSRNVSYAMFAGGGLAWADRAMKAGRFAVAPAPSGTRPDLSGLSCRWDPIAATHGVMLSLVVAPGAGGDAKFRALIADLLADLDASNENAHPLPYGAPGSGWPGAGLELEAKTSRQPDESPRHARWRVWLQTIFAYLVFRLGLRIGGFDPRRYRDEVLENSDFRKYDDVLRMTLDCTPAEADRIEARLAQARAAGVARYGMYRQEEAIMTCLVPSASASNHLHFIDGASGGYALAARQLKAADAGPLAART